jgi:excisionase family DNA binding protein
MRKNKKVRYGLNRRYLLSYQTRNQSDDILASFFERIPFHYPGEIRQFYTVDETASTLRITRVTVQRKLSKGEIPSIHIGRRVLIPAAYFSALSNIL